jgi:hypothetical protein
VSGPGEVGSFSAIRVVLSADSRSAWRLWQLAYSTGVNDVPGVLASLNRSVMVRTASERWSASRPQERHLQ